jgi:hypothetical protein
LATKESTVSIKTPFDQFQKGDLEPINEVEGSNVSKPLLAESTAKPNLKNFIKKMTINETDNDAPYKSSTNLYEESDEASNAETNPARHTMLDVYWSKIRQQEKKFIAEKKAEARECEFGLKMERGYLKYKIMLNILFIPLWSSFLLIFLSFLGGDIVNIIYFGLTPIDTLMDGCLSRQFLSSVNGIMINTHRKIFKYRSKVNMVISLALSMNVMMCVLQFLMFSFMITRMAKKTFFYDNGTIQKSIVGDGVITLWFLFDFMTNCFQIHRGIFVVGYSGLIASDVSMRHIESVYTRQFGYLADMHAKGSTNREPCNVLVGDLDLKLMCLDEDMWKEDQNGKELWENFYGGLRDEWESKRQNGH